MFGLILIAAIIGSIWIALIVLRAPLLTVSLACLGVAVCAGYDFLHFKVGPATLTCDRLALVVLVAAFVIQRHLGCGSISSTHRSDWILGCLLAWLAFSMFMHDPFIDFRHTATPFWRLATAYAIPAFYYWTARQGPLTERGVNATQWMLALFGLYLAVTGILEARQQWDFVFPRYIADPKLGMHFGRARGPMLSSVDYGLYLGVCFLCAWSLCQPLDSGDSAVRGMRRMALLFVLPLLGIGIRYSYTRSIWMGVELGTMILLVLTLRGARRIVIVGSVSAATLAFAVANSDSLLAFKRDQGVEANDAKDSAEMRLSFARVSWEMFKTNPLLGVGFGQFPANKLDFLSDRSTDLPLERIRPLVHHNTFLSVATETGVIGFAIYLALLLSWIHDAWLIRQSPSMPDWARRQAVLFLGVMGLYACQLLFHELSYSVLDNCLVFLLAGMTVGLSPEPMPAVQRRVPVFSPVISSDFSLNTV